MKIISKFLEIVTAYLNLPSSQTSNIDIPAFSHAVYPCKSWSLDAIHDIRTFVTATSIWVM